LNLVQKALYEVLIDDSFRGCKKHEHRNMRKEVHHISNITSMFDCISEWTGTIGEDIDKEVSSFTRLSSGCWGLARWVNLEELEGRLFKIADDE
jgi:hypothetical protein